MDRSGGAQYVGHELFSGERLGSEARAGVGNGVAAEAVGVHAVGDKVDVEIWIASDEDAVFFFWSR